LLLSAGRGRRGVAMNGFRAFDQHTRLNGQILLFEANGRRMLD
jgi:hypothetical protein